MEVEFDPAADFDLDRLDQQHPRKILTFLAERIAKDEDSRQIRRSFAVESGRALEVSRRSLPSYLQYPEREGSCPGVSPWI